MEIEIFFKAVMIGFCIAAPVGPIGLLCIQRTVQHGLLVGLASGLGAATADAIYGAIGAFGLSAVTYFLVAEHFWLNLFGGIFLCFLGYRTFRKKPADHAATEPKSIHSAYLSTALLTLSNPMTIFAFIAIFAALVPVEHTKDSIFSPFVMVAGVFFGSALWWLILSGGIEWFREKFSATVIKWMNRISGFAIFGFGFYQLIKLAKF